MKYRIVKKFTLGVGFFGRGHDTFYIERFIDGDWQEIHDTDFLNFTIEDAEHMLTRLTSHKVVRSYDL